MSRHIPGRPALSQLPSRLLFLGRSPGADPSFKLSVSFPQLDKLGPSQLGLCEYVSVYYRFLVLNMVILGTQQEERGHAWKFKSIQHILADFIHKCQSKKDVWEPMAVEEGGWMANHLWCRRFQLHVFSVWKSLTLGSHVWHFYNNSIHVRPNIFNCYRLWGRRCEMFHRVRCISTAKHRPRSELRQLSFHYFMCFSLKCYTRWAKWKPTKPKTNTLVFCFSK